MTLADERSEQYLNGFINYIEIVSFKRCAGKVRVNVLLLIYIYIFISTVGGLTMLIYIIFIVVCKLRGRMYPGILIMWSNFTKSG